MIVPAERQPSRTALRFESRAYPRQDIDPPKVHKIRRLGPIASDGLASDGFARFGRWERARQHSTLRVALGVARGALWIVPLSPAGLACGVGRYGSVERGAAVAWEDLPKGRTAYMMIYLQWTFLGRYYLLQSSTLVAGPAGIHEPRARPRMMSPQARSESGVAPPRRANRCEPAEVSNGRMVGTW